MQTAGARALREDHQDDMSREAVLLQWERKIEAEERRPSRFEQAEGGTGEGGTVAELRPTEDATHEVPPWRWDAEKPRSVRPGRGRIAVRGVAHLFQREPVS